MRTLKRVLASPSTIIIFAVMIIVVYLCSVLSSNAFDDFDYGIHYAQAMVEHGYWTQARAAEMIRQAATFYLPGFFVPIVLVASITTVLIAVQRWLHLRQVGRD